MQNVISSKLHIHVLMLYRKQVTSTYADAEHDGVVVPRTLEEYCVKGKPHEKDDSGEIADFYDDDDDYFDDYDDEDCIYESDDNDSGNEES